MKRSTRLSVSTAWHTRFRRIACAVSVAAALFGVAPPAQAANYAVIVGVGNYELEGVSDLQGPENDVRLMREALEQRGVPAENITVLSDGVEGSTLPTRAAIMDALNGLVEKLDDKTEGGDAVTLYFSGHGTRQPDQNNDEQDGLDELFLPIDIREWSGSSETGAGIPNAIVDDELGDLVSAMRAKNASVWLIMDSCHSGSGTRFAQTGVRARQVRASTLNIPEGGARVTVEEPDDLTTASGSESNGEERGSFVAFFAAQSFQQAVEVAMETETAEGTQKKFYGLFTAHLSQRLKSDPHLTFRQLFDAVKFDIERFQAARSGSQWPAWEASPDAMNAVPLNPGAAGNRTWRLSTENTIDAGQLHGLRKGSVLAVYDDPAAAEDDIVGHIQIGASFALTARFKTIKHPCEDTPSGLYCKDADDGKIANAKFARLIEPAIDVVLRLSEPQLVDDGEKPADYSELKAALETVEAMSRDGKLGLKVEFNQDPYNVSVGFKDGRLWFGDSDGLTPAGISAVPSSIAWPAQKGATPNPKELAELLSQLGRIQNLATASREMNAQRKLQALPEPMPLDVKIEVERSDRALLSAETPDDLIAECRDMINLPVLELKDIAGNLTQCDKVSITLKKTGNNHLDVTVLYKDARGAIHVLFPEHPGGNRIDGNKPKKLRLFGGPSMMLCAECPNGAAGNTWSFGREDIYIIAAEVDGSNVTDLSHLAQPALSAVGTRSVRGAGSTVSQLLTDLVFGGQRTRGTFRSSKSRELWIESRSWSVWPRGAMKPRVNQK